MQKSIKALLGALSGALPDALIVTGVAAISYGAGLLHPAAGFITSGVLMLGLGYLSGLKVAPKAVE